MQLTKQKPESYQKEMLAQEQAPYVLVIKAELEHRLEYFLKTMEDIPLVF